MWKPVPNYESQYEVSDEGKFRRISSRSGRVFDVPKPKDGFSKRRGYLGVEVCSGGKKSTLSAHRVVWEAFNGPIPPGMQINHKNGIKDDNRLSNLEVVTPSQNTRHAFTHLGREPVRTNGRKGSLNHKARLKETDIPTILELRKSGLSQQAIADRFGVCQTTIGRVLLKKSWIFN